MALFLVGLILHLDAERRQDRRRMIASTVLFLLSAMTYEIMLPLVLVHEALAARRRTRREAHALALHTFRFSTIPN